MPFIKSAIDEFDDNVVQRHSNYSKLDENMDYCTDSSHSNTPEKTIIENWRNKVSSPNNKKKKYKTK